MGYPNGFWWIETMDFPDFNIFTPKKKSQSQRLWLCLSNGCSCYRLKVKIIEDITWQTIASVTKEKVQFLDCVASKIYDWYAPLFDISLHHLDLGEQNWHEIKVTHPRFHIFPNLPKHMAAMPMEHPSLGVAPGFTPKNLSTISHRRK